MTAPITVLAHIRAERGIIYGLNRTTQYENGAETLPLPNSLPQRKRVLEREQRKERRDL